MKYRVMDVRRVIPFPAVERLCFATAIRNKPAVLKDFLVLVPLAHQPVLESQCSAAFELEIQRENRSPREFHLQLVKRARSIRIQLRDAR